MFRAFNVISLFFAGILSVTAQVLPTTVYSRSILTNASAASMRSLLSAPSVADLTTLSNASAASIAVKANTNSPTIFTPTLSGTTSSGPINSSGTVTATNFAGSGAGLTNLPSGFYNVKWLTAEPDGTTDITPLLQYALDTSKAVEIPAASNPYLISGLSPHSGQIIRLHAGATLKLKAGADHTMIYGNGVTNVLLFGGGTLDGNYANQIYPTNCSGFYFVHCTNIFVSGINFRNMLGFSLRFGDFSRIGGSDITFDTPKDGIHLNGPGGDGFFNNVSGYTGDDLTAICASDWTGYDQTAGSVSNIVFQNIFPRGSVTVGRILAGTGTTVSNVTYRTVKGWTTSNPFGAYEDTVGNTKVGDIFYDDINVQSPGNQFTFGANIGDVTISNWRVQGVDNNLINCYSNLSRLTINNASIDGVTNTTMIFGSATASITNIYLNNVSMRNGYTLVTLNDGAKKSMIIANGITIDGLSMGFQLQNDFTLMVDGVIAQNISGAFLRPFGSHSGYAQIGSRFFTNNIATLINKDTPFTLELSSAAKSFNNTATLTQKRGDYVVSNNGLFDSKNSMILGAGTERVSISSGNIGFNRDTDTGAMYDPTSFGWQLHHTFGGTSTSDFFTLQLYDTSGSSITPSPFTVRADGNIGFGTTNPLVKAQFERVGGVTLGWRDTSQPSGSQAFLARYTGGLFQFLPGTDQMAAQSPGIDWDRSGNSTNAGHVVATAFIGSGAGLTNLNADSISSGVSTVVHGGTGGTTSTAAFNNINPTTTMGDLIYGTGGGTAIRLAPNVTTTHKYLEQHGDGTTANAPGWLANIPASDIAFGTNLNLTVSNLNAIAGITTPSLVATAISGDLSDGSGYSASALVGAVPTGSGGTAQTTYTNGQLLIGNSSGNTLSKSVLTAGHNVFITNGNGSIAIASADPDLSGYAVLNNPLFTGQLRTPGISDFAFGKDSFNVGSSLLGAGSGADDHYLVVGYNVRTIGSSGNAAPWNYAVGDFSSFIRYGPSIDLLVATNGSGGAPLYAMKTISGDTNNVAGETRLLLWDVTAGAMKRVSIGASDSGGTGYKVLRIPN